MYCTDYYLLPVTGQCIEGQQTCSPEDSNCFSKNEHCDGIQACLKGEDEMGCGKFVVSFSTDTWGLFLWFQWWHHAASNFTGEKGGGG